MNELQDCIDNRFGSVLDILAHQEHFINVDVDTDKIVQYFKDQEWTDKQIIDVLLVLEDGCYKAEYYYEDYMNKEVLIIDVAGHEIEI